MKIKKPACRFFGGGGRAGGTFFAEVLGWLL
jgi:hypothetical protein